MIDSTGRVAIVTGASRGIGAAIARLLGESGFAVGVNYLSMADNAQKVVTEIEATGGRALAIQADVRDQSSVEKMVKTTQDAYESVDVLVNNAMGELPFKPFNELVWEDFKLLLDVQVRGAVNCCQAVLPLMESQGQGSIVNIISTSAFGTPPARMSAYVTAKSALVGLTKALAVEYTNKGIRINMVSPGATETDLLDSIPIRAKEIMAAQNPMRRLARPEDCAQSVLFLVSDQSEYVSGANIVVSGGQIVL